MEFFIETDDLQKAIKLLSVTAKMNAKDSTGKVRIVIEDDGTISFLSDNKSTALLFIARKVQIVTPGAAVVEYSQIKSFVAAFRPWNGESGVKDFHFKLDNSFLNVTLTNTHENGKESAGNLKLKVYDVHGVRPRPTPKDLSFTINSNIFATASTKILYAINPNNYQRHLRAMKITFTEKEICFVGTDGQRLSEYKVKNISDLKEGEFSLGYEFLMGLRRVVDTEGKVSFEFNKRDVIAVYNDITFWGKPVLGEEFPPYSHILDSFENVIVIDKEVLMSTLLPFNDILNPDDHHRLTFSLDAGRMAFKCDVAEFEYNGEVDYPGKFVIDINGQYMIQTVDVIKDDKITLRFSNEDGVLIFDSGNFEDQNALITPIRRR